MVNLAGMRRALRYCRTWGLRAAVRRAGVELRNTVRRRLGRARPEEALFDPSALESRLADPALKLVIFDVFDTLLERPLPDPDGVFRLLACKIADPSFPARRQEAESLARSRASQDVGLAEIYAAYIEAFGEAHGSAAELQRLEEGFEYALSLPRDSGLALLAHVRERGFPVVLASDTALSAQVLTTLLDEAGVLRGVGYDRLYTSADCGQRKSTGQLFERVLHDFEVLPAEVLVIGDHPLSDHQIPASMGLQCLPIESARVTAQRFPRFTAWSNAGPEPASAARELLLGLLGRTSFSELQPSIPRDRASLVQGGRYGVGYAVLGPVVVAFSDWLKKRAERDGMQRLYFLSREGKFLQTAFRRLHPQADGLPEDRYLVVSRRVVSVASMHSREDVREVAATTYLAGPLEEYLYLRFGLEVGAARLDEWHQRGLWPKGQKVEVAAGRLGSLQPLLDELSDEILQLAAEERQALLAYLQAAGLDAPGRAALVDVGYAASTQSRLIELSKQPVHGYYLLTRHVAAEVRQRHEVIADGCFAQDVQTPEDAPMLRYCLALELMLGADDPQVERYRQDVSGRVEAEYLPLSEPERASVELRQELREGALAFIDDWRRVRERTGLPLVLEPAEVDALFTEFWEGISESERSCLAAIAGDDHYCGRGVIGFAEVFGP